MSIAVAEKSKEKSKAEKEARESEAEAVAAAERVTTARETEIANRNKGIAIIKATEKAQQDAVGIKVAAEAKKISALDEAEAVKTTAKAGADAVIIKAKADEERYRVEAEGKEKLNEAENKLSLEIIRMRIQLETIKQASSIVEASVKPIEAIEGMKVINIGGLGELVSSGNGQQVQSSTNESISDQLINSLLKYRGLAPVVDSILKEVDLDFSSVHGIADIVKSNMEGNDKRNNV